MSEAPTLVVIQNGKLEEKLEKGVAQNDFVNRIRKVLGANPIPVASPTSSTPVQQESHVPAVQSPIAPMPAQSTPTPPAAASSAPISASAFASTPAESTPTTQSSLSSKAKGKQKAVPADPKPAETISSAAQSARDALRKKKQEEKEELERIKARIEADKAERRAQAEARKAERELERQAATPSTIPSSASINKKGSQAKEVHLNVRMFDGHTVRHTFPHTATLENDVRPWVDTEFAARAEISHEKHPPYHFKQILAPLPSREISAGEESEALGDIDLAPSATLVLIPVKGYTEAYSDVTGGLPGVVSNLFRTAIALIFVLFGFIGNLFGSRAEGMPAAASESRAPTLEQQQQQRDLPRAQTQQSSTSSNIRIRTLADQRMGESRDQHFYNGNQVSTYFSSRSKFAPTSRITKVWNNFYSTLFSSCWVNVEKTPDRLSPGRI